MEILSFGFKNIILKSKYQILDHIGIFEFK